jgi:T4-like virus Myoviridae tail sheath stabiliser
MLQNNPYYWGTIRKVVIAFGAIFSDIHIVREDSKGNPVQAIQVPCEFGPKEKWMTRNVQNPMPGVDDSIEMVLPRMSYEVNGFTYDSERKLTSTGRTVKAVANADKTLSAQFNPVPYNIGFTFNIMTKTIEDGLMIIEQILPFFTPDYTVTVKDMPELDLTKDIPVILNNVTYEDTWDGTFQQRRTVIWTLQFTAKAYLYPPVKLNKLNLQTDITWNLSDPPANTGA